MRIKALLLVLTMLTLGALACNLKSNVGQPPTGQPVLPTDLPTATFSLPTITPLPTSTTVWLPPTAIPTAAPVITATPSPARIRFSTGATASTLADQPIGVGGVARYVINVMAGQTLIANVTPYSAASLPAFSVSVYAPNGALLGRSTPGIPTWSGKVPATGDYRIEVQNSGAATAFTLQITVPGTLRFGSGETTTAVTGSVTVPEVDSYIVEAGAGQYLSASIVTPGGNAWLAITGQDGTPLLRADARQIAWQGVLPGTQGYLVQVGAGAGSADYTLRVTIPQRVQFAAGTTAATVTGQISGQYEATYALEAAAGQWMDVRLSAPETGNNAWLAIEGADGSSLLQMTEMKTAWSGVLPGAQNYLIRVISSGGTARYSLDIAIARRINFAPGSTAARLDGTLVNAEGVTYVLEARAGQTMSVSVTPAAQAYLMIRGADGAYLAEYEGAWSGVLPATQDYLIRVAPGGGATNIGYVLDVSITG